MGEIPLCNIENHSKCLQAP